MKRLESGYMVADEMGISPYKLEETFNKYNEAAKTSMLIVYLFILTIYNLILILK